jgi:seryl-tRNA synthetase
MTFKTVASTVGNGLLDGLSAIADAHTLGEIAKIDAEVDALQERLDTLQKERDQLQKRLG